MPLHKPSFHSTMHTRLYTWPARKVLSFDNHFQLRAPCVTAVLDNLKSLHLNHQAYVSWSVETSRIVPFYLPFFYTNHPKHEYGSQTRLYQRYARSFGTLNLAGFSFSGISLGDTLSAAVRAFAEYALNLDLRTCFKSLN